RPESRRAAVEHPKWVRDHARILVVFERDWRAVRGVRVEARVLPTGDGDRAELLAGRAIFVHVPAREQRIARWRADETKRLRQVTQPTAVAAVRRALALALSPNAAVHAEHARAETGVQRRDGR